MIRNVDMLVHACEKCSYEKANVAYRGKIKDPVRECMWENLHI